MAGEIQLNSTNFASESGGTITINNATVGSAVAMSANQACVKTAINASGSAPIFACRAWINFDGTSASIGTGRANGNISGVTDNGTGDYSIAFTTAMQDANYVITGSSKEDTNTTAQGGLVCLGRYNSAMSISTTSFQITTRREGRGDFQDSDYICVCVFR